MNARRVRIALAVVVVGVVGANLVALGLDRAVGGANPGGATGSAYATAARGTAAFASLLAGYGHDVTRVRGPISDNPPAPGATAFVLEPDGLTADDTLTLLEFASDGGRLIIGGPSPFYLSNLRDRPPRWQPEGVTAWTDVDPSLSGVHDVEGAGTGSWSARGSGTALVGGSSFSLVTRDRVGRGEILFLADASPLENAFLASGDNAAFGLALAGDAGRPVVFPEGVHGYGAPRGIAAIPDRWKVALVVLAAAALAFVWSRARRFGPADCRARELPPARAEYVRALSDSLERTRDRTGALAPAQRWAAARVAARAGLGANAGAEEIERAARVQGCPPDEVAALLGPVTDDAGVLALGRAVARAGRGRDLDDGRMQ